VGSNVDYGGPWHRRGNWNSTLWKPYLTSLFFTIYTITSVGYGDVGPKNYLETCVAIFMVIILGIAWAIMLGQVCDIAADISEEESEFRLTMDGLTAMLADHLLPSTTRLRLRSFFPCSKLAQRRVHRQQKLITFMSPGMQGEVVMIPNKRWMEKVPAEVGLLVERKPVATNCCT